MAGWPPTVAVTSTVTTVYTFTFDKVTGLYTEVATAGAPVAGTRNLTAAEVFACPVLPQAPTELLASTGSDVAPWGVGIGLLALLSGVGILIGRKLKA